MDSFYSRKGDDGYTNLLGEGRVPKFHPQPEAYGSVDEVSSVLGLAKSLSDSTNIKELTTEIQRDLYHLMAELAATKKNAEKFRKIDPSRVEWLEAQIKDFGSDIEMPDEFIIPGDSKAGAAFDLSRTVTRRAERAVAKLYLENTLENSDLLKYLNRLSSLCFILSLWENILSLWENKRAGHQKPTTAKNHAE
jgi:cob(I)alamin adenosyltransferase